jgi:hypothetical protein
MVATGIGKRAAGNGNGNGNGNGDGDGTSNGHADGAPTLGFEFHSPDFEIPSDVVQYTQDKVNVRLGKYGRRVMGAIVHVRDLNGPKGGVGFACHLETRLSGMEPVNVEERDADLRAAIDLAIDRTDVVVGRHVGKARSVPRHKGARVARQSKTAG